MSPAQTVGESKPPGNEFEPDAQETSTDRAAQLSQFDRQARQIARQAALDPGDGIKM